MNLREKFPEAFADGPGPVERRWTSRMRFKLSGRWPAAVVEERLWFHDVRCMEIYAEAGGYKMLERQRKMNEKRS